jgi:hypothetical protein
MPQANAPVLKADVPEPSQLSEKRLHKRYVSEQFTLTFLGADHTPINWSLGGFLVADRHPHTAIGTVTSGFLSIRAYSWRLRFSAELVRRDEPTRETAFRFINPSRALVDALNGIVGQR